MSAIPGRRRKRTVGMFVTTVVMVLLAPVLFWVGFSAVLDSTGGKDALADNLPEKTFPATPTVSCSGAFGLRARAMEPCPTA